MHIWRTNTENVFIYLHCATILGKMHFCGNTSNAINCCFLEIYLELSLSCSSQNKGKIRDFLLHHNFDKINTNEENRWVRWKLKGDINEKERVYKLFDGG